MAQGSLAVGEDEDEVIPLPQDARRPRSAARPDPPDKRRERPAIHSALICTSALHSTAVVRAFLLPSTTLLRPAEARDSRRR